MPKSGVAPDPRPYQGRTLLPELHGRVLREHRTSRRSVFTSSRIISSCVLTLILSFTAFLRSGRRDSHPRSLVPQTSAMTRLRYDPVFLKTNHERAARGSKPPRVGPAYTSQYSTKGPFVGCRRPTRARCFRADLHRDLQLRRLLSYLLDDGSEKLIPGSAPGAFRLQGGCSTE